MAKAASNNDLNQDSNLGNEGQNDPSKNANDSEGPTLGTDEKAPQQQSTDTGELEAYKEPKIVGVKVVKPFRDRDNFAKEYKEGDDVSHLDEERLTHLARIGHIEPIYEEEGE